MDEILDEDHEYKNYLFVLEYLTILLFLVEYLNKKNNYLENQIKSNKTSPRPIRHIKVILSPTYFPLIISTNDVLYLLKFFFRKFIFSTNSNKFRDKLKIFCAFLLLQ